MTELSPRPSPTRRGRLPAFLGATLALGGLPGCEDERRPPPEVMPIEAPAAHAPEAPEELDLDAEDAEHGRFALGPGFVPDPFERRAETAGGPVALASFDSRCVGFAGPRPDHVLDAERAFAELAIHVRAPAPTSLLVVGPDGEPRCGELAAEGARLEGTFSPGSHRIWVGTEQASERVAYVLTLSELELELEPTLH